MKPKIVRVEIEMDSPDSWTYRLFDHEGLKRFEGGARSMTEASQQAINYTRQVEQGVIVI